MIYISKVTRGNTEPVRWGDENKQRHKTCQRYLSLNVRSENEKAEKDVRRWKWTSLTGREKKDPKKDDYISILSGNQVREANKKIYREENGGGKVFQEKTIAFWSLIYRLYLSLTLRPYLKSNQSIYEQKTTFSKYFNLSNICDLMITMKL